MDHWGDRPEVQARQRAQPTGTNRPTRTTHTHTPTHTRTSARARRGGRRTRPRVHYAAQNQPTHPPKGGAGHQGPRTTTPPPSRRPQRAGKRPDPYRTRKLSPPAPMVLPPPGSGRVGHHRNTHQPTGPRGAGAPTRRPPPRGPAPHPHPIQHNEGCSAGSWWRSDHLRCAGPRRSDPRSRMRNAHPGVRGAAAPGAAVREIVG